MTIEDIRKLKRATPFAPFELLTRDNRIIVIERALAIALAPSGRSVAGFDPTGHPFFFPLTELTKVRIKTGKRASQRSRRNGSG